MYYSSSKGRSWEMQNNFGQYRGIDLFIQPYVCVWKITSLLGTTLTSILPNFLFFSSFNCFCFFPQPCICLLNSSFLALSHPQEFLINWMNTLVFGAGVGGLKKKKVSWGDLTEPAVPSFLLSNQMALNTSFLEGVFPGVLRVGRSQILSERPTCLWTSYNVAQRSASRLALF